MNTSAVDSESLERFEIIEQLGRTKFVTTFKAIDRRHKRFVVIKVLAHKYFEHSRTRLHIRRQIKRIAELRHPYLLPILRSKETQDAFYWVTPFMEGGNLQSCLDAGVLTQEKSRFVTSCLGEALTFAHDSGVHHLNLDAGNVLFDAVGNLQLFGFNPLPLNQKFGYPIPDQDRLRNIDFADLRHIERQMSAVERPNSPSRSQQGLLGMMTRFRVQALTMLSVLCLGLYLLGQFAPLIGAVVAPRLRMILGNEQVAALETTLFRMQDRSAQIQYELGLQSPEAPWEQASDVPPVIAAASANAAVQQVSAELIPPTPAFSVSDDEVVSAEISPTTPAVATWQTLPNVPPQGTLEGEGIWQPYLTTTTGEAVARRTFIQPDPERPLTVLAVVAFDLTQVDLNYILGTQEPARENGPRGDGTIPDFDRTSDKLLATFNGGFMSTHGGFGAMQDGIVALAAREQLATVAIEANSGAVQIGAWGAGIRPDVDWQAYRQNARLIIESGAINDDVYNNSIADWGGTVNSDIVTWRSAIGLNAEQTILYYVAGPSVSMPALADALVALEVENGMLLDINAYWVHFAAIEADENNRLQAKALFEEEMAIHDDRYLRPSSRDFFYITLKSNDN
ncbi:MAG: protein kinase domain-containing protein [Candidatus Promineifilaceae bacterium]